MNAPVSFIERSVRRDPTHNLTRFSLPSTYGEMGGLTDERGLVVSHQDHDKIRFVITDYVASVIDSQIDTGVSFGIVDRIATYLEGRHES